MGETRPHIESAAVKEDADTVSGEGAEAAGGVLDGLDFAVESFSHRVGDGVGEVGEQSAQVVFECVGGAFDQMEFATAGTGIPLIKKRAPLVAILLMPRQPAFATQADSASTTTFHTPEAPEDREDEA